MIDWKNKIKSSDPYKYEIGNIWSVDKQLYQIIEDMCLLIHDLEFDIIAGIEAKGFIYASALSYCLQKPLAIIRKKGKLSYTNEKYETQFMNWKKEIDGLEIEKDQLRPGLNALVVDDLAYKLKSFYAAENLLKESKIDIAGYLCFANISGENEIDGKTIYSIIQK